MKKLCTTLVAVLIITHSSYAQWTTSTGGGITTTTDKIGINVSAPAEALDINGNIRSGISASNYLQIGGGANGTGGYFQGTQEAGNNAGYGAWVNHNAYWNGTNWIQPRGNLSSSMFASDYHLGFIWKYAPAGLVDGASIAPVEQMRLYAGQLGIGTAGITTSAKLHIIDTHQQLRLGYNATSYNSFTVDPAGSLTIAAYGTNPNITLSPAGTGYTLINNRVSIGTTPMAGIFQVNMGAGTDMLANSTNVDIGLGGITTGWARAFRVVNTSGSNGQDGGAFGVNGTGTTPNYIYMAIPTADQTGYNSTKILVLNNAGNVGIGTRSPDTKLTVNGSVHAKEVKVDMNILPDYVFDNTYDLTPLNKVKEYIVKNHHLPEVPSAEQVSKDGLKLGEMNALLLKKVEELTLYAIDQQKQIEQLKQQDEVRITALEKALAKLTNVK
ncbi:MAG: hypothetical protein JWR50_3299 [Mucilaginibacter sp.]|nr:hypothetical protein [Mucilaginibacter sp.]